MSRYYEAVSRIHYVLWGVRFDDMTPRERQIATELIDAGCAFWTDDETRLGAICVLPPDGDFPHSSFRVAEKGVIQS